jgi:hypothetical protein
MIAGFLDLQSFNDGKTKSVSVVASEDATGGTEILTFVILNETKVVTVNIPANQMQVVRVEHTASGKGLVKVSAANSPQTLALILDVDKQPGDDGTGSVP